MRKVHFAVGATILLSSCAVPSNPQVDLIDIDDPNQPPIIVLRDLRDEYGRLACSIDAPSSFFLWEDGFLVRRAHKKISGLADISYGRLQPDELMILNAVVNKFCTDNECSRVVASPSTQTIDLFVTCTSGGRMHFSWDGQLRPEFVEFESHILFLRELMMSFGKGESALNKAPIDPIERQRVDKIVRIFEDQPNWVSWRFWDQ